MSMSGNAYYEYELDRELDWLDAMEELSHYDNLANEIHEEENYD